MQSIRDMAPPVTPSQISRAELPQMELGDSPEASGMLDTEAQAVPFQRMTPPE